jgi:hypothetical protein
MLSPQELVGQKVWVRLESDFSAYGNLYIDSDDDGPRVQAEITQPTSPPWFYARYLNPPATVHASGQWLTYKDAEEAVLMHPVLDYDIYANEDFSHEEYDDELDLPQDYDLPLDQVNQR